MVVLIAGVVDFGEGPRPPRRVQVETMLSAMTPADVPARVTVEKEGAAVLGRVELGPPNRPGATIAQLPRHGEGRLFVADAWLHDQSSALRREAHTDEQLLCDFTSAGSSRLADVRGEFAFASWNAAERQLTCGRDHFGVRPLFYATRDGGFAFASLEVALTASGFLSGSTDLNALRTFVAQRHMPQHLSLLTDSHRVHPATVISADRGGIVQRTYWQLGANGHEPATTDLQASADELRERLTTAVKRRLPSEGRIGAHLSGGLDSSTIAVLAARLKAPATAPVLGLSYVSRDSLPHDAIIDERAWVEKVLQAESGISTTWLSRPPVTDLLRPSFHPDRCLPLDQEDHEVAEVSAAAAGDTSVILSGWGGDECVTFNGRGTVAELVRKGRWRTALSVAKALAPSTRMSAIGLLASETYRWLAPELVQNLELRLRGRQQLERSQFLRPEVLEAVPPATLELVADGLQNRATLLTSDHIQYRLENWAYRGAAIGARYSFPMLDIDLVEYAMSLPSEYFVLNGQKRTVFRLAVSGILPADVLARREKLRPFPAVDYDASVAASDIADLVSELEQHAVVRELFNIDAVHDAVRSLPSPEQVLDALRSSAAAGQQAPVKTGALMIALHHMAFVASRSFEQTSA